VYGDLHLLPKRDVSVPIHAREPSRASSHANVVAMIDDECWENMAPPLDDTPRRLAPRSFVAHCEREPGRLQLRLVLARDEHVDDIVVEEEDDCVVAFAAICSPTIGAHPEQMEGPFHVYLEQPLGERKVIDALTGREVPYRNVLAELAEKHGLNGNGAVDDDPVD
jgi:hypothetical protein